MNKDCTVTALNLQNVCTAARIYDIICIELRK
nr:MAG TPA_asm: hypothetical protein [Caudoviricetes sp.]